MDKNAEVVACGASIMKDVWEIRLREYRQKRQLEEERIQKSALERINQDWKLRMSGKIKTPKRLEKKAKLPEESTLDVHKAKNTHLGRPQAFQSSRIPRQVDSKKTTKSNKLALLRQLNQSCPGLMVWAKSWKFMQPLAQPKEIPCAFDWGQSWKFLNFQPGTDGKPWIDLVFDANNDMSSNDMFLWEKLGKALDSEHIQQDLVASEWEKSWIVSQETKQCHENTNKSDCNKVYNQNEVIASNWNESWKSTKPKSDLLQPTSNEEKQPEISWNDSWMHFKKQLHMKSKATDNSAWSESWKVVTTVSEKETKSIRSQAMATEEQLPDICSVIMNVSREIKHAIPWTSWFVGREAQLSEWEKSWATIKSLSEYKEEINKEVEVKVETLKPDKQPIERVKFHALDLPKSQKRQEMHTFCELTKWKDSWKMVKHQQREERVLRNRRLIPSEFTRTPEWANSWRFTNLTLNQDAGLWQQGWSTNFQPRLVRRVRENVDIPHNGPTGLRTWAESWRSTRRPHRLERQAANASSQPVCQQTYPRSVVDWEQSWTSSTHPPAHDRPSMTAWADSWRFSGLEGLQREHAWCDKSMEIKELVRASNAFSRSFHSPIFKERNPANEWADAWRIKKRLDGPALAQLMKNEVLDWDNSWMLSSTEFYQKHLNSQLTSGLKSQSVEMERRSGWGEPWKIANPQPPKSISSWIDAKPRSFNAQDLILCPNKKSIYYLPSASLKDLKPKMWSKSWRFMKINLESTHGNEFVIMTKTMKIRKELYLDIDQQKPQMKSWRDACKLTQPRAKRNVQSSNLEDEEMLAEWTESWMFSNNLKTSNPAMVSLKNWKTSWKYLLNPNVTINSLKTSKNR